MTAVAEDRPHEDDHLGGSRHYTDRGRVWEPLSSNLHNEGAFILRHGTCPGATEGGAGGLV